MAKKRVCSIVGCGKNFHAHGFCSAHASRFIRHGDPLAGRKGSSPGAPLQWIKDHINYEGNDCLKWPFEIGHYGYGTVKYKNKRRVSSRVMCILAHGNPPTKKHEASHSCGNGNKACMNPKHLRWKTKLENIQETVSMGKNVRGEKAPNSILTESTVLEIRKLGGTMMQKDIAKIYRIKATLVSGILSRKKWGWLKDAD